MHTFLLHLCINLFRFEQYIYFHEDRRGAMSDEENEYELVPNGGSLTEADFELVPRVTRPAEFEMVPELKTSVMGESDLEIHENHFLFGSDDAIDSNLNDSNLAITPDSDSDIEIVGTHEKMETDSDIEVLPGVVHSYSDEELDDAGRILSALPIVQQGSPHRSLCSGEDTSDEGIEVVDGIKNVSITLFSLKVASLYFCAPVHQCKSLYLSRIFTSGNCSLYFSRWCTKDKGARKLMGIRHFKN